MRFKFDDEILVATTESEVCEEIAEPCSFHVVSKSEFDEGGGWQNGGLPEPYVDDSGYIAAGMSSGLRVHVSAGSMDCLFGHYPFGEPPYFPTYPSFYPNYPPHNETVNTNEINVFVPRMSSGTGLEVEGQSDASWDDCLDFWEGFSLSGVRYGSIGAGNGGFTEDEAAAHKAYYEALYDISVESQTLGSPYSYGPAEPCDWIVKPVITVEQWYPESTMSIDISSAGRSWLYTDLAGPTFGKPAIRAQNDTPFLKWEDKSYSKRYYCNQEEWSIYTEISGTDMFQWGFELTECPYEMDFFSGSYISKHLFGAIVQEVDIAAGIGGGQDWSESNVIWIDQMPIVQAAAITFLDETAPIVLTPGQVIQIPENPYFDFNDQIANPAGAIDLNFSGHVNQLPDFVLTGDPELVAPNPYKMVDGLNDFGIKNVFSGNFGGYLLTDYIEDYTPEILRCRYKKYTGQDLDIPLANGPRLDLGGAPTQDTTEQAEALERGLSEFFVEAARAYIDDPSKHLSRIDGPAHNTPVSAQPINVVGVVIYFEFEIFEDWLIKIEKGCHLGLHHRDDMVLTGDFSTNIDALVPPDHVGVGAQGYGTRAGTSMIGMYRYYQRCKLAAQELAQEYIDFDFETWPVV